METNLNYIIQSVVGALVVVCGFLITRLISKNDDQHKENKEALSILSEKVSGLSFEINDIEKHVTRELESAGMNRLSASQIRKLADSIREINFKIQHEIKPSLSKADRNHKEITRINEELQESHSKLRGVYETVFKIVDRRKQQERL